MTAMNGRVRTIADPVRFPMPTLPSLGSKALLEPFLAAFETQLTGSGVAADQWKYHLTGQIEDTNRAVLADLLAKEDSTYNDLVRGLGWLEADTTISAVERFFAAEVDGSKISNVTEALDVTARWLNKVGESATDKKGMINVLTKDRVRTWFNSLLKEYLDHKERESNSELVAWVNQWLTMRGDDKPVFVNRETRKVFRVSRE